MSNLTGYRTLIVQAIVAATGILVALGVLPAADVAGITTEAVGDKVDTVIGAVLILSAIVGTAMRFMTKGKVGAKTP